MPFLKNTTVKKKRRERNRCKYRRESGNSAMYYAIETRANQDRKYENYNGGEK